MTKIFSLPNLQSLYMKTRVSGSDCKFNSRDDMTLLIRNFSFDMPHSIENSKQSSISSPISGGTMMDTNTSYSSTNQSTANYSSLATDRRTKPYVSFDEYFKNVEIARKANRLPKNMEFD